jgi:hypothetical protein
MAGRVLFLKRSVVCDEESPKVSIVREPPDKSKAMAQSKGFLSERSFARLKPGLRMTENLRSP